MPRPSLLRCLVFYRIGTHCADTDQGVVRLSRRTQRQTLRLLSASSPVLQEDGARLIIYHWQGATCWRPEVKGVVVTVNSAANGWRWEDAWIDR